MDTWLVFGLGNPGDRYSNTRHNAGARAVEHLARELGAGFKAAKGPAVVAEGKVGDARVIVCRPTTYMNESGRAVAALSNWYKVEPAKIIVLHDDIDLEDGALRLKQGGGTGGNHGLDSIVSALGSKEFFRVRIGVGRPADPRKEPADYVLAKMNKGEAERLAETEVLAADAAQAIITDGLERAMNTYNNQSPR